MDTSDASGEVAIATPTSLRDGQLFRDCAECPEMVVIPAGTFTMGSPASEADRSSDEGPQRRVTIARFALGKTEVTRGEWAAFVRATGRADPLLAEGTFCNWRNPGFAQDDNHPVTCVNWEDARAYAAWLSQRAGQTYRLPSEAEWEYAARAGTTTPWFWGNDANAACQYARADCSDGSGTAPAGSFRANALGLYDVAGNLREWVEDCYADSYADAPTNGSAVETSNCPRRVLRGGFWGSPPQSGLQPLRSAKRVRNRFSFRDNFTGFRLARSV